MVSINNMINKYVNNLPENMITETAQNFIGTFVVSIILSGERSTAVNYATIAGCVTVVKGLTTPIFKEIFKSYKPEFRELSKNIVDYVLTGLVVDSLVPGHVHLNRLAKTILIIMIISSKNFIQINLQ